jgi:hypothetical protein
MIITQKIHVHAEQRINKQLDKENTIDGNQQNEDEKATIPIKMVTMFYIIPDTLLKVSLNTNKTDHHVLRYT